MTDIDWPLSFYSTDDSTVDSTHTQRNPEPPLNNPYVNHHPAAVTNQPTPPLPQHPNQPPITKWITRTVPSSPANTHNTTPRLPMIKLKQLRRRPSSIQVPLHELIGNDHWGDIPSTDPAIFRVISKNVNSISTISARRVLILPDCKNYFPVLRLRVTPVASVEKS